jgi:hypothetical protein
MSFGHVKLATKIPQSNHRSLIRERSLAEAGISLIEVDFDMRKS